MDSPCFLSSRGLFPLAALAFPGTALAQSSPTLLLATHRTTFSPPPFLPDAEPAPTQKGSEQSAASAKPAEPGKTLHGNFFRRLIGFYQQDWHGTAAVGPTPPRRALDAPLDSPPFPSGD